MPSVADRVKETTTTTGTGTVTLAGAPSGYQTFSTAFGSAVSVYYVIAAGTEWEVGIGTTGSGTLSRDTVLASSNSNALVNFSAGPKDVFCAYPAGRAVTTSDAATLTNKTISGSSNTLSNIANASLANSSVTVNGTSIALGASGTVAAAAGTLTGTTLASNVVSSSLTSVGTIATGVWQGTAISDTYLATISTAGKVSNSATTAASANTASAIVARDASGNFTAGTITAALSGNASTATALQTARTINGTSFDGTANITVTAAAGTLTGSTLASGVTASSLTSVGTLSSLTVSGVTTLSAGTASAPALTTSGDTNTGLFFPAADTVAVATGGSERIRVDSAGRLGVGVTPSAWDAGSAVTVDVGSWTSFAQSALGGGATVAFNAYESASGTWKYKIGVLDPARYEGQNGLHRWYTAPSGSAGSTITWTERMRVDATTTAGQTALLLWDVDNGTLERVTVGAADSGGTGYKVLRIPN